MKKIVLIPAFSLFLYAFTFQNISDDPMTWERTYQGPASTTNLYDDYAYAICKADENNFYVAGGAGSASTFNPYIIKINPFGDTIWSKEINLSGNTSFKDIVQTEDNGCILVDDGSPARSIRLDSAGNILWNKTYGMPGPCYKIIKLSSGDYLIHGRRAFDSFIFKIDSNGELLWSRNFSSGFYYLIYSITESLSNNEFLITGFFSDGFNMPENYFINRLNSNGDTLGIRFYEYFPLYEIININDGYITGGLDGRTLTSPANFGFAIFDSSLNLVYRNLIDSDTSITYGSFKVYSDNKIVVATNPWVDNLPVSSRIYMIDFSGNVLLHKELYSPVWTYIESIEIAENGHILFAGDAAFTTFPFRRTDYYVVRTDSMLNYKTVSINDPSVLVPQTFKLYQNYPNPFNPTTNIKFSLPTRLYGQATHYTILKVFDALGREVATLVNETLQAGVYQYQFTTDKYQLPSGVYFYTINAGDFKQTRRMILLK